MNTNTTNTNNNNNNTYGTAHRDTAARDTNHGNKAARTVKPAPRATLGDPSSRPQLLPNRSPQPLTFPLPSPSDPANAPAPWLRLPDGTRYIDHCAPQAPRALPLNAIAIYDAKTGAALSFRDVRGVSLEQPFIQQARIVNGIDVIRHAAWAVHARPEEVYTWVEIGGASYRVLPYNYIDEVVLNQQTQRNEFGQVAVYVYREAPVGTQRNLHGLCAGCRRTQEAVQLFRVKEELFEARELADAQDRVKAGVQRGCTPAYVAKLHEWRQELEETCAMLVRSLRSTQCNCYGECDATHPVHAEHWLDLYVRGLLPEPYAVGVAAEAGLTRAQGAARLHRLHEIGEPPAEVVFVGMPPKRPRRSNRAVVASTTTNANATANAATTTTTTTNTNATTGPGGAITTTSNTTPGAPPPSRAASLAQEDGAFDVDATAEGAAASLAMEVASESDGEASEAGGCTAEEDQDDAEPDEAPAAQQEPAAACNDAADDEHQARNEDQDAKDDDATSDVAMDEQAAHSAAEAVLSSVFDDGDSDDNDDASASSPSGIDDDGVTAEHDSPRVSVLQRLFDLPVPIDMPCAASTLPPRARRSRSQVLEASAPPDSRSASPATPSRRASVTPNTPPTVCHRVASSTCMGPVVQDRSDAPQTSDDTSPTPTRPIDTGNKASKPARATTAAAKRAAEKEKAKQRRVAQAEREAAAQAERKAAKAKAAVARAAKQAARERAEEELLTRAVEKTTAAAEAAEAAEAAASTASGHVPNNTPMWFSRPTGFASLFFGGRSISGLDTPSKLRSHFCTPSSASLDEVDAQDAATRPSFWGGPLLAPPPVPDFSYPGAHLLRGVAVRCHYLRQLCSTRGAGNRRREAIHDIVQDVHRMTDEAAQSSATFSHERLYGFAADCVLLSVLLMESVVDLITSNGLRARETTEVLLSLAIKLLPFATEYFGSPVFAQRHRRHSRPCTMAMVCCAMLRVAVAMQVGLLESAEPLLVRSYIPDREARCQAVTMLLGRLETMGAVIFALTMGLPLSNDDDDDDAMMVGAAAPVPLSSCFVRGTRLDVGHRLISLVALTIATTRLGLNDENSLLGSRQRLAAEAGAAAQAPLFWLLQLSRTPLREGQQPPVRFGEGGSVAILVTAQQLLPRLFRVMGQAAHVLANSVTVTSTAEPDSPTASSRDQDQDQDQDPFAVRHGYEDGAWDFPLVPPSRHFEADLSASNDDSTLP